MRVVSIDVGISNLAICVMSLSKDDPSATIHYWKVLDLMDPDVGSPQLICSSSFVKSKKKCERKAYCSVNDELFCKTHDPCKKTKKAGRGGSDQPPPVRKILSVKKRRKVKTLSKQEICERMINALNGIREESAFLESDHVVIELQPGKNQRMKALSEMIFTYFSIRKLDQDKTERKIKQIKFINAKNKLSMYKGPPFPCKLKDRYARRKFLGIEHCKFFIEQCSDTPHLNFFLSSSKKDDLADCYLQGLYFLSMTLGCRNLHNK